MAVHIQAMKIDTDKQKEKKDKACQRKVEEHILKESATWGISLAV